MVAGAVLLARAIEAAPVRFVAQRLRRLLPAVAVWSAFYFWWRHANGEAIDVASMARDLAFGMPQFHLWFLFAMLGLYVLMPGVRLMVRGDDAKPAQYFIAAVLAAATCVTVVGMVALGHVPVLFISYTPLLLVYLVCGHLFYRDQPAIPRGWLWAAGVLCVGGTMLVVRFLEPGAGVVQSTVIQALRAPLALGWVLVIFLAVMSWRNWRPRSAVARGPLPSEGAVACSGAALRCSQGLATFANGLAPITLGIYALHPFWIDVVDRWLLPFKQGGLRWMLAAVLAYALSAFSSWCISRVPRLRPLVS
jgi:surface polysaccharide O-acyltransferase-like enzyme